MALVAASSSSSSSRTSETKQNYVFLSFRGEDTRDNFISHLYTDLYHRKKIKTFIDEEGLRTGEEISQSLLEEIEESKIAIVVLSKGYASSTWCLEELAKIIECKKSGDLIVVPVFYHVDPSDVRKQSGSFGEAFVKHEERFKQSFEKVQKWRAALTETANISGLNSKDYRHEAALIEKIVDHILESLNHMSPCYNRDLVGIEPRIKAIELLLNDESEEVILVGIWGMGGIGKTTLARAVFNKIRSGFEGAFFLDEVTIKSQKIGLRRLRQKLISDILEDSHASLDTIFKKDRLCKKKILLVLDDVINWIDIGDLIEDLKCLGSGNRIIITSREKQVLKNCGVKDDNIYEVKGLCYHDAFKLFSWYAFKQNHPIVDYETLSKRVVIFDDGVPLALKVLGGLLLGKTNADWENAISNLENNPEPDIHNVLKLSYDQLNDQQRSLFLDIACFFKGANRDIIEEILDVNGFTLGNLNDKALITIKHERIEIHNLLQKMGRQIVELESKCFGRRSRLWREDHICRILRTNTGTEAIEGIRLDMSKIGVINLNRNAFSKMCILRFFDFYWSTNHDVDICQSSYVCNFNSSSFFVAHDEPYCPKETRVHAPEGLEFPSYELRFFRWPGYPLESLPSNFYSENLIALLMPYSNIKQLSKSLQYSEKLKYINLMHCKHLITMSNLSLTPNLKSLILEGCTNLIEVTSSIDSFNKLVTLNLAGCTSLRSLPTGISAKFLSLVGCSNLEMAPEITSKMEELYLDGTAVKELSVIELASRLKTLTLEDCSRLERIPDLSLTPNLETLSLHGCRNLIEVPPSIRSLNKLDRLILWGCTSLRSLPTGIRARTLLFGGCSNLEMAPEITSKVECLALSGTAIKELPVIELPSRLKTLRLLGCSRLESLPNAICELKSLERLYVEGCPRLDRLPDDFGKLEALRELVVLHTAIRRVPSSASPTSLGLRSLDRLDLSYCQITEFPDNLGELSSLRSLCLRGNYFACIPASVKKLPNLEKLDVSYCEKLQFLPKLSSRRSCRVKAICCASLEKTDWLKSPLEPGEKWSDYDLNLAHCYKLDQNQVVEDYMGYLSKYRWSFRDHRSNSGRYTIFPGNEIPDCLDIRNMDGSSLTIKPPLGLYVEQYRLHFAVCVVFELQGLQNSDFSFFLLAREMISTDKYGNEEQSETATRSFHMGERAENEGHRDHVLMMNDYVDSEIISFTWEFYSTISYEVKKCGVKFIGAEPNELQDEEDEEETEGKISPEKGDGEGEEEPQPKRLKLN